MKVLHLMGALRPSGMERMLESAAPYFARSGIDAVVVGQGSTSQFEQELRRSGYGVREISSIKSIRGMVGWARSILSERPDVIHIHPEGAFSVAVWIAHVISPRTPIVRTVHSLFMPTGRGRLSRELQSALADPLVAKFVACSPAVGENERALGRDCAIILNWVDDRFLSLREIRQLSPGGTDDFPSIVVVGNSSPMKNHQLVLRAVAPLDLRVYFHGDESGATEEEVGLLDELSKAGRLLHRGPGDPGASLIRATAFALPSLVEGMGVALAEAVMVGIPCFVNDIPGIKWSSTAPNVRVLVNSVDSWSKALEELQCAPVVQRGGSAEAAERPLNLSASRGASEYFEIYRQARGCRTTGVLPHLVRRLYPIARALQDWVVSASNDDRRYSRTKTPW